MNLIQSLPLALKAELRFKFILKKRYILETVMSLLALYGLFMGIFLGIKTLGGVELTSGDFNTNIAYGIISYVMWSLSSTAFGGMNNIITSEALAGTLEQLYLSPFGFLRILILRALSGMLFNLIEMIALLSLIMVSTGIYLKHNILAAIPVLIVTLIGLYGFGFILAGLALIFKRTGPIVGVIQFLFLFLSVVPLDSFSMVIKKFLQSLPLVQGVSIIKRLMVHQESLSSMFFNFDLLILGMNSVFYALFGILFFKWIDGKARHYGLVGHY